MIRATLDVNVLASGFPAGAGPPAKIIEYWGDLAYDLIISEHILTGLARAWQKPYYLRRYSAESLQQTLAQLRSEATLVVPTTTVQGIGEDTEDDLVLATAIAGNARFLVTGDKHLQELGRYQDLAILSPRQFLDLLEDDILGNV